MHTVDRSMTLAGYRVLVADDDPLVLRQASKWLADAGCQVRTAADGRQALEAIETDCPERLDCRR